ncbi:hypothetical protein Tco_1004355 [Tanacetum coccineum]|uniref:Uncharacterized protein n=1 Tax=Tanacetum coccineum TaxID=301880 RepID=A0ABQ5FDK4_9ASTR
MASLDYRLNPMYTIKECSSCGSLYNKERCCSKGGFVDKFVRDPNKTPDSSHRPPPNCPKCRNPVDGLYCRQCALLRKKLKEVWSTICYEDENFQDFLNTYKSSNDKTNVVNAPQDPFVFNQDSNENSSQRPPHIDHHCCYRCGDSLDGIFCQRCTCESCGNDAHYGYNCPPKVSTISNPEPCHNQNVDEFPQTLPSFHRTCYSRDGSSFTYDSTPNFVDDSPNVFNPPPQPPTDDKSSHEEVIHEISFKTYSNPLFDLDEEIISSEFNPIYNEDLDSTLKNDRFDTESYLPESLLNRNTLMASSPKIDSLFDEFASELITIPPRIINREHEEYISLMERLLYDNSSPRPPKDFHAIPNTIIESLPTFPIPVEDSDSLREEINIFPDSTIDVVEDIPVDVPNILPTHHIDFDFIPSHNDLGSDLDVSSPFGDRNKIYDPGICIEVESTRFLATHSPVIDTFLPFSSENEDKAFNHGVLDSKEKSPPSLSYRGFKASKLFQHKSRC